MSAACSRGAIIASAFTLLITCVLATNRVNLYRDTICLGGSGFETPEPSDNGQCHKLINIRGVKPVKHDVGCEITIYSDPYCSSNATLAPINECGNMTSIGSYSLDCFGPQPVASQSTHRTSTSTTPTTEKRLATSSKPLSKSSTLTTATSPTSPPLPSTSPQTLPLHSIDPYSHIYATRPASTPSSTSTGSEHSPRNSDRTNLSTAGTIALAVVIPAVSVIVAIIFGVRMWNWDRGGGGEMK